VAQINFKIPELFIKKEELQMAIVHWSIGERRLFPSLKSECGTPPYSGRTIGDYNMSAGKKQ